MSDPVVRLNAALGDRYVVEREIGSGGMATVCLAEDLKHHRPVAIKVLDPDLAVAVGADRFLREIETAANLTHPHILPLHDSGEADGFVYYVMPYVERESLRARLEREQQLPVDDAVQITREIADALAYPHERGVIHRDVKPANILLEAGHAVLAFFGFFVVLVLAWYHGEKGRQRVGGPELLTVAALLVAASVALSALGSKEIPSSPVQTATSRVVEDGRPAIAVPPFDSFSPSPDDARFADGVHEEIISKLSKISALRVISHNPVT